MTIARTVPEAPLPDGALPGPPAARTETVATTPLTYTLLLVAGMFGGLMQTALTPGLAVAGEHFGGGGAGAITAQMIITLAGVGAMLGGPIMAVLARRAGIRTMLLVALAIYAIGGSAGLVVDSRYLLFASRILQGAASAGIAIAASTLIADRFTGAARPQFLGFQRAFLAATGFCALLLAGQIAENFGWRAPFAMFLLALPVMLLVLLAGPALDSARVEATERQPLLRVIGPLWPIYLTLLCIFTASYTIYLNLPFVLAAEGIRSPAMQAQILAAGTACHFAGGLIYGRLFKALGSHWILVLTLGCLASCNLLVYVALGPLWFVAACGIAGFAGGAMMVFATNLLLTRATPAARPQAMALMLSALYLGQFVNPMLTTPLRLAVGNREAFLVVASLLLAFAASQLLLGSKRSVGAVPAEAA